MFRLVTPAFRHPRAKLPGVLDDLGFGSVLTDDSAGRRGRSLLRDRNAPAEPTSSATPIALAALKAVVERCKTLVERDFITQVIAPVGLADGHQATDCARTGCSMPIAQPVRLPIRYRESAPSGVRAG